VPTGKELDMIQLKSDQLKSASSQSTQKVLSSPNLWAVAELLEMRRLFDQTVAGTENGDNISVTWNAGAGELKAFVNDVEIWSIPPDQMTGLLIVSGGGGDDSIGLANASVVINNQVVIYPDFRSRGKWPRLHPRRWRARFNLGRERK
jgi:hypothetical protein